MWVVDTKKYGKFQEIAHLISTILSWTLFVLLSICGILLIYYFVSAKVFAAFGSKYEPKFSLYAIMSPSMTPNIQVYDVIVDLRVDHPEEIAIGDVITFVSSSTETKGMIITHRVVSIFKNDDGTFAYQTKGDANPIEDSGLVDFNSVIGKVALKIPALGRIQVFAASATGWLLIILCVALFIILKSLIRKLRQYDNSTKVRGRIGTILHKPLYLPYPKKINKPIDPNNLVNNSNIPEADNNLEAEVTKEDLPEVKPLITEEDDDMELPKLK